MADDVRSWSDELARNPSSLVFLQLGEALRRQGDGEFARRVATRGLERHPHRADAHDLLARVLVDAGDLDRAFDEWDATRRLQPGHAGALKGMGFIRYRQGALPDAERYLGEAAALEPSDATIASALAHVRAALDAAAAASESDADEPMDRVIAMDATSAEGPSAIAQASTAPLWAGAGARALFDDVLGDGPQAAMLLDAEGFVLAGAYHVADGRDVAQDVGAELSGVSDEAARAMRHLGLGEWESIVFETGIASVAMSPAPDGGLLVVAAAASTPLGLLRRMLVQCSTRARAWLAGADG